MATPPPASFEGEVKLKFLFANFDGVAVELSFPYATRVASVKETLLASWPERVTTVPTAGGMRLLTAGRLLEDGKTLAECKVPRYDAHATPVNVALLPKGKSYTEVSQTGERVEGKKAAAASGGGAATAGGGAAAGAAGGAAANGGAAASGGCCVIA